MTSGPGLASPRQGWANHTLPLGQRGREEVWQTAGEGVAPGSSAPPPPGPGVTKGGRPRTHVPPGFLHSPKLFRTLSKLLR